MASKKDPDIPPYTRCDRCKKLVYSKEHLPFCSLDCAKDSARKLSLRAAEAHRRMRRSVT